LVRPELILLKHFPLLAAIAFSLSACVETPRVEAPRPVPRPVARPVASSRPALDYRAAPAPALTNSINALWRSYPDRAGIAIARADGTWMIGERGDEYMPQQSVSKLWVAITVLQAVDEGRLQLSEKVTVRDTDLTLFNQPIEDWIDADGFEVTLGELLEVTMTMSDNTANDFLMRRVGGPSAVRAMLAAKGLTGVRFGPGEIALQSQTAGIEWKPSYRFKTNFEKARAKVPLDVRQAAFEKYLADPIDGATPVGIARALLRLKRGELLSAHSTQRLLSLMAASGTGKQRIRAGVPLGWGFAHKTGTGQQLLSRTAGYNDVSLMTAPDGTSYAVVVLIADTSQPVPDRQAFMQSVAARVAANHRK
jgi:beta-lactamase class A